jgi:hypothetical protein
MAKSEEHRWAIDALDEGMVRIEEDGKRMLTIPRYLVPPDAREGQLLRVTHTDSRGVLTVSVAIDAEATSAALASSVATTKRAMARSKKQDPGGDVNL